MNNDVKDILDSLLNHRIPPVRAAAQYAIGLDGYTAEALDSLIDEGRLETCVAIAEQGYGLDKIIDAKNPDIRIAIAKLGYGLDKLVEDSIWAVRKAVAEQGYGLDQLVNDEDYRVRITVAEQGYGLDKLVNNKNPGVRKAVADQGYGLDQLVNDEDWAVREAVARQGYGLEQLVNDENEYVRETAKEYAIEHDIDIEKHDQKNTNILSEIQNTPTDTVENNSLSEFDTLAPEQDGGVPAGDFEPGSLEFEKEAADAMAEVTAEAAETRKKVLVVEEQEYTGFAI